MSWYVINCRSGREQEIIHSLKQRLSPCVLEDAFLFQCERLWRRGGAWELMSKTMFPGYVFLESSSPLALSAELNAYRSFLSVMENRGYLISIYDEEERWLSKLCGKEHCLKMSYGYKDRGSGVSRITDGPLKKIQGSIRKIDWHRRYAQIKVPLVRKEAIVWAGIDLDVCWS